MNSYINYHKKLYPEMITQDIIKLLYQNEFAGGHMISNPDMVKQYYFSELEDLVDKNQQNLYDIIGPKMVRLNMIPYKNSNFNHNYLIDAFIQSANNNQGDIKTFNKEIQKLPIDSFIKEYNMELTHHSLIYNQLYYPHYRVVEKNFITMEMKEYQIKNFISTINKFSIIALEGKCASGKTSLANTLNDEITIISCDDFFLPENLKTKARLQEIGGYINYEAIKSLLEDLKPDSTIKYQIFNCHMQSYTTKTINIKKIVLLEGVYSYHPFFRSLINYMIYLTVDENEQLSRLQQRTNFDRFINEWIPLENKYYESFDFIANANLLV